MNILIIGENQELVKKVKWSLGQLKCKLHRLDFKEKDLMVYSSIIKRCSIVFIFGDENGYNYHKSISEIKAIGPDILVFLIQRNITATLEDILARGADYFFPTSDNAIGEMAQVIKTLL